MRKQREIIPQPRSVFLKVQCPDCGTETIIFDRASTVVKCHVCGAMLAEPGGGKARLLVKKKNIIQVLS
ncbi:MAG: 30S ribosomal protein S27e [Candidatus Freyarchaeota archaeon]|nr:30S ribosomal protein S27e [Candidatus Freyrarchaeum guaymaensis]HDO80871.1 30S ribosomal protein S27e [Candidatus Bathyarchaeota archaeon]